MQPIFKGGVFKRFVSALMSFVLLTTSVIIPTGEAFARADPSVINSSPTIGQFDPDQSCIELNHASAGCGWYTRFGDRDKRGSIRIRVPRDNWRYIASMRNTGRVENYDFMVKGEGWITFGIEAVGQLGLDPSTVPLILSRDTNGNPPWVVARYFPEQAKLKIDVYKIIRDAGGVQTVYVSNFTPHHGEHWRASRRYLTASERRDITQGGFNPFEAFRGLDNDPVFHNISWGAAQVAISHAMQYHDSVFTLYVETHNRMTQTQSTSGNFLRKTVTTTTTGYATPHYYLAMPLNMSPQRNSLDMSAIGMICVTGATSCDNEAHVVTALIALEPVDGGNIPVIEEQLYRNVSSSSSWSTFAYALMTAALTYGAVSMYAAAAAGGATAGSVAVDALATNTAAAEAAAQAGLGYAGTSTLTQGGGLTSPQDGWMGRVGWDPSGVGNGSSAGAACSNPHCQGLYAAIQRRQITSDSLDTGTNGNFKATNQITQGNCDPTWTVQACRDNGLDPGVTLYRPDSYIEARTAYQMKIREQQCKAQGLTGLPLRQCIAPPIRRP